MDFSWDGPALSSASHAVAFQHRMRRNGLARNGSRLGGDKEPPAKGKARALLGGKAKQPPPVKKPGSALK
eukprot:12088740-Alexandrium_andersonii.AAC.1